MRGEGFEAEFILLDVNDEKTQESAARVIKEKFGKLDILVNNAGSALESSAGLEIQAASQTPMEIYRKTFEANFRPAHADAEVVAASQKARRDAS